MLEFGSLVQAASALVASAVPPPVMLAVPLSVHAAVALLFHRYRKLLMFPHCGAGRAGSGRSTGLRLPEGAPFVETSNDPLRSAPRKAARSRGGVAKGV